MLDLAFWSVVGLVVAYGWWEYKSTRKPKGTESSTLMMGILNVKDEFKNQG